MGPRSQTQQGLPTNVLPRLELAGYARSGASDLGLDISDAVQPHSIDLFTVGVATVLDVAEGSGLLCQSESSLVVLNQPATVWSGIFPI